MIGYVMVGTNDIKQSLKLYDKILPFAGMKKIESTSDYVGYASIFSDDEKVTFYITKPYNGKNATFGNAQEAPKSTSKAFKSAPEHPRRPQTPETLPDGRPCLAAGRTLCAGGTPASIW